MKRGLSDMEKGSDPSIPSSPRSSKRKASHHVEEQRKQPNGSDSRQQQHSLSTLRRNLRSWWTKRNQKRPMIPQGLTPEQRACYDALLEVVVARPADNIKAPRIVVITDLAKDYDDLAAMIVLKELHRLDVVTLLGFIANLMPAERRSLFGRGALNELGLQHIPIARGTSGYPQTGKDNKKHTVLPYEFDCKFMDVPEEPILMNEFEGEKLLHRLCTSAVTTGQKLTLLLISSLEDIFAFSVKYPDLLRGAVANIVLQGGYYLKDGKLLPDEAANNNRYDIEAAIKFHGMMQEWKIPSAVWTKVAAFATPLTSELFHELEETGHILGSHLRKVQVTQDLAFYGGSKNKDPKMRFAPFMDQVWFLKNRTFWYDYEHAPGTPLPEGDEIIPWLNKVVVYDALAAVGSAGPDAITALKILTDEKANGQPPSIHKVIGFPGPPVDTGIHPEQMATVLSALLKGSLLACQQKIL